MTILAFTRSRSVFSRSSRPHVLPGLCNCHLPSTWALFNLEPFPPSLPPSVIYFSPSKVLWHWMINLSSIFRMGAPGGEHFSFVCPAVLKQSLGHERSLIVFYLKEPVMECHTKQCASCLKKSISWLIQLQVSVHYIFVYIFMLLEHTL